MDNSKDEKEVEDKTEMARKCYAVETLLIPRY
jgi:hypothetical protein